MKIFFITLLVMTSFLLKAQTKPVEILVGKDEAYVRNYFSRFISLLKENKYVKIDESTNINGDLFLEFGTPTSEEAKTNSRHIITEFIRLDKKETCVRQTIMGSNISAYTNILNVKDSFENVGIGEWISNYVLVDYFKIKVTYKIENGSYALQYTLVPFKKEKG